jgi:hypothetical protein
MLSRPFRKRPRPIRTTQPRGLGKAKQASASRLRLWLEALEDRSLPSLFTVTTVADDGLGSFREAILDSNSNPGTDTIAFNIGGGGVQTIQPLSALPEVMDPVVIDATTQPGYAGAPLIVLNGSKAGSDVDGLVISAGNSTVRGLVINSFYYGNGIVLASVGGNHIAGNYFGTDVTGTMVVDLQLGRFGIVISSGQNNVIGGTTAADRNVISSYPATAGIAILGDGTVVQGNYIGTDATGSRALVDGDSRGEGIRVFSSNNVIGGTESGAGNLISGNALAVGFSGGGGNRVQGNYIGTDATGTRALGNDSGVDFASGSSNNLVGGLEPGARNVVASSTQTGIFSNSELNNRVIGNYIGTDVTGTVALPNGAGIILEGLYFELIGNLISGNITYGAIVGNSNTALVQGNYIGTDATGTAALPNRVGIRAEGFGPVIGGTAPGAGNLISGNSAYGIEIASERVMVQGNTIGADVTRTRALGNGAGVLVNTIPGTVIGGTAGNLISGNVGDGITGRAVGLRIEGNLIGTNLDGTAPLGNGGNGISLAYAENTVIGGSAAAAGNVISGNGQNGIALGDTSSFTRIQGNLIGTNATGTSALANGGNGIYVNSAMGSLTNLIGGTDTRSRNVISGNALDGIRLEGTVAGSFQIQGNYVGTDGSGSIALPNRGSGVMVNGGTSLQIGGSAQGASNLVSGNKGDGVALTGGSGHVVQGNFIGTNAAGTSALPNTWGVRILGGSNQIGGTGLTSGNLISGNRLGGIEITTDNNRVQGNFIGTDVAGTFDVANGGHGVLVSNSSDNQIGGAGSAGNLISGNKENGVDILGDRNLVLGNLIGTNASGTAALPNFVGLIVESGTANVVGGTSPAERNVISGNTFYGVFLFPNASNSVVHGNFIGTDVTGSAAIGNDTGVMAGGTRSVIGGSTPGAGNLLSGNATAGVIVVGADIRVEGNRIGTDVTGTAALRNTIGVFVAAGAGTTLVGGTTPGAGNLISGNGAGLRVGNNAVIQGNKIGTDITGTGAIGNGGGMLLEGTNNLVGGTTPGAGNLISGNFGEGIQITNRFDRIQGNLIGTDITGTVALPNRDGIFVKFTSDSTIGGIEPGARNVISGNRDNGVHLLLSFSNSNTRVLGNYIGTDATGSAALGNGRYGVYVDMAPPDTPVYIGGTEPGAGNVISANGFDGIFAHEQVVVQGNYVGTDATGSRAMGNGRGVVVGTNAIIGGKEPGAGNVISGNLGTGISVGTHSVIQGNLIGVDATGTRALGNDMGIELGGFNLLGGTEPGMRNVISGNRADGVLLAFGHSSEIKGNFIGTDVFGTTPLGNRGNGVTIQDGSENTIGATDPGAANTIAFNGGAGVVVQGVEATGNRIEANAIYSNAALGIDLGGDGVTTNDLDDLDAGPNQLQNYPTLSMALGGSITRVIGTLSSLDNTTLTLNFYASATADPSGFGEGARYLGSTVVTADSRGNARFEVVLAAPTSVGEVVTATTTDPDGNTSEFSPTVRAGQQVAIDIKPGDPGNAINLGSNGVLPVAVLTASAFDAGTVDTSDLSRVHFGDAQGSVRVSPVNSTLKDVDSDGDIDLVLFFSIPVIREMGALTTASTEAELTGVTSEGIPVRGTDIVRIVPPSVPSPPPAAPVVRGPSFVESFLGVLRTEPQLFRQLVRRLHLTIAEVTGDGTADIILLGRQKGIPFVMVIDGVTGQAARVFPFAVPMHTEPSLMIADVNGDGVSDVIVRAIALHGPRLWAFDVLTGRLIAQI